MLQSLWLVIKFGEQVMKKQVTEVNLSAVYAKRSTCLNPVRVSVLHLFYLKQKTTINPRNLIC